MQLSELLCMKNKSISVYWVISTYTNFSFNFSIHIAVPGHESSMNMIYLFIEAAQHQFNDPISTIVKIYSLCISVDNNKTKSLAFLYFSSKYVV